MIDTGKEGLSLYFSLCEDVPYPCAGPGRCWLFEGFNSCMGITCSNWLGQDPDLRLPIRTHPNIILEKHFKACSLHHAARSMIDKRLNVIRAVALAILSRFSFYLFYACVHNYGDATIMQHI